VVGRSVLHHVLLAGRCIDHLQPPGAVRQWGGWVAPGDKMTTTRQRSLCREITTTTRHEMTIILLEKTTLLPEETPPYPRIQPKILMQLGVVLLVAPLRDSARTSRARQRTLGAHRILIVSYHRLLDLHNLSPGNWARMMNHGMKRDVGGLRSAALWRFRSSRSCMSQCSYVGKIRTHFM